jgi:hypothetical protein
MHQPGRIENEQSDRPEPFGPTTSNSYLPITGLSRTRENRALREFAFIPCSGQVGQVSLDAQLHFTPSTFACFACARASLRGVRVILPVL